MTHHNSPRHAVCADRATLAAILPHRQRDHDGAGLGTVPSRPARSARPARPGRMEQAFLDGLPEHARLIRWQLRHRRFASLTRELETLRGLAHAVGYRDIATQSGRLLRERLRTAAWRSTHDPPPPCVTFARTSRNCFNAATPPTTRTDETPTP